MYLLKMMIFHSKLLVGGLEQEFFDFPFSWECHGAFRSSNFPLKQSAWWFGILSFFFPFSWECHFIPTDELYIFFRGVGLNHQPPSSYR